MLCLPQQQLPMPGVSEMQKKMRRPFRQSGQAHTFTRACVFGQSSMAWSCWLHFSHLNALQHAALQPWPCHPAAVPAASACNGLGQSTRMISHRRLPATPPT